MCPLVIILYVIFITLLVTRMFSTQCFTHYPVVLPPFRLRPFCIQNTIVGHFAGLVS